MKIKKEVELDLSSDDLAECFINWDDGKQSEFINKIGSHFKKADFNAETQCCSLATDINKDGRDFIYTLANFIKVRGIKCGSPKEDTLINTYETDGV